MGATKRLEGRLRLNRQEVWRCAEESLVPVGAATGVRDVGVKGVRWQVDVGVEAGLGLECMGGSTIGVVPVHGLSVDRPVAAESARVLAVFPRVVACEGVASALVVGERLATPV